MAGCPNKAANHALKICDMAFDMMDGISMLKDPGTGKDVQMRIGCHTGPVVAGIVGSKMPRYAKIRVIKIEICKVIGNKRIVWKHFSDVDVKTILKNSEKFTPHEVF